MRVTDYLKSSKDKTFVSFEILPPQKGADVNTLFEILDPLMEFNPPFIDVTYHREEYVYKKNATGFYEKTSIRKRPGTVGICAAIIHKYGVEAVPHILCGGFTKDETEDLLIELNFLNIKNVLALRGDARKFEPRFVPEDGGHHFAVDLVRQIEAMNNGHYLDHTIANGMATNFCIGVAGYPEKHYEARNYEQDILYAKQKVDAGADYIVTQMFYDNKRYFNYVDRCREAGITVPIIPGLKPISKKHHLTSLPRTFFIDIPEVLASEMDKCKSAEARQQCGVEWAIMQSLELKEAGVPCLHYYTMGETDMIKAICEAVL